jgi:YjjG family noncanonical pyrimidine nucleotidase
MKYEWIIFDADGTLFDYDHAEKSAIKRTFNHFGHPYKSQFLSIYRHCNKQLWDAFELGKVTIEKLKVKRFELLLETIGIDANAEQFGDQYLAQLAQGTELIGGAEKVLKALSGKVGLILMTNGIKEVQRSRLNLSPINHYFSDIIISDEVGVAKPDKKIFEIAQKNMSILDKRTILMVGDNLSSDIRGGNDFGIDTCWYNPNKEKSDPEIRSTYEIQYLQDILPIIDLTFNLADTSSDITAKK